MQIRELICYFEEWASLGYGDRLDVWRALTTRTNTKGKHEGGRKKSYMKSISTNVQIKKKGIPHWYAHIHTVGAQPEK